MEHQRDAAIRELTPILSPTETAALLGVSRTTIWRLRHELPPAVQLSARRIGWRRHDLLQWIDSRIIGQGVR